MSRALKRIESQKIVLMFDFIMWGVAASLLKLVTDEKCKTCYTNGEVIGYNPAFIDGISDPELLFVLAHEVLHVLLGHCFRVNDKDPDDWNEACDYVVNLILVDLGLKAPPRILLDEKFRGMSAEEVYFLIHKERNEMPNRNRPSSNEVGDGNNENEPVSESSNSPREGSRRDAQDGSSVQDTDDQVVESSESRRGFGEIRANDNEELKKQWQHQSIVAATQAKQRGQLPNSLRRIIVEANSPEVDFIGLSYLFVQKLDASDYSWSQPNRSYLPHGIYVPSLSAKRLGPMVFANDTSGSISDFQQACAQKLLTELMCDTRPELLTVIHFDSKVQKVETFEEFDQITINPIGGGGTDFCPVFHEIGNSDLEPAGLIVLTDLEGTFPERAPDYPVLWISTTPNRKAPFGETVFLDLRGK